jgi:WD40 repeat protein
MTSTPDPLFILKDSKPITSLLFSKLNNQNILFTGSRNGDFQVYNLESRRLLFKSSSTSESILKIFQKENETNEVFTYNRDGSIFKWNLEGELNWISQCIHF